MHIKFDNEDLEKIAAMAAAKVVDEIRPLLRKSLRPEDPLLSIEKCSEYLNVSKAWLYKRTSLHEIPCFKIGGVLMFRRSELDAWIARNGKMPQTQDLRGALAIASR